MSEEWRGKVGKMTEEEINAFLAQGNLVRTACLDKSGAPYVTPMWYQYDPKEKIFWLIPRAKSKWAEYLKADPRVALTIDESTPPYRKVLVRGRAELVEEPNVGGKWVPIAEEMSYRYLGENGPKYLEPTLNEPRWLFKVVPEKVTTWQGVDWAARYKTAQNP